MTHDIDALVKFAEKAACYFDKKSNTGEDSVHWASVANAENCRKLATALQSEHEARVKAVEAEREECAKVAEKQLAPWVKEKIGDYWEGYRDAIEDAVKDIRARTGETR